MGNTMVFADRVDAGKKLAERLQQYKGPNTIVLAIPRGGVVVGYEVAVALGAPLDVVIPRKIGAPEQPELAIGAIAANGGEVRVMDDHLIHALGVTEHYIEAEVAKQLGEIERRRQMYRAGRPLPPLDDKTVVLVDDGIATGSTVLAAIRMLKKQHPGKLVLAVPVAPPDALDRLRAEVDDMVVLETPEMFFAVGAWYVEFAQTEDREVIDLLHRAEDRAS